MRTLETLDEKDKAKQKNDDYKNVIFVVTIFILAILSVVAYNRTYSKYFSEIILLSIRYSLPALLVFTPILLSVVTLIIFIFSQFTEKNGIEKADKKENLDEPFESINNLENRNKIWKKIHWTLMILTVISLIGTQLYLNILIYFLI